MTSTAMGFALIGALAIVGRVWAQTPPPPPPAPPRPQTNSPATQPPPERRPVKGSMNGLLDYMADVDVTDHEEIDSPAVGYGNELLWEASKPSSITPPATPTPTRMRQARKSGDKDGSK